MDAAALWPVRVVVGHRKTFTACLVGIIAFVVVPRDVGLATRAVIGWDLGAIILLGLVAMLVLNEGDAKAMARNAANQQEGEWTVFGLTLVGVLVSFAALTNVMGTAKDMQGMQRKLHIAAVAVTLLLSWLVTQVVFALRYAHEYYERQAGAARVDGGLVFPGELPPDYWDFIYFAFVLGMTFQVSDVQITSRKLRRLATAHGLIGFLFNAVIVALTVNIAASLL